MNMSVKIAAIVLAIGLTGFMIKAQDKRPKGLIKETGQRIIITDGNQLYAWCSVSEKTVILDGGDKVKFSGSNGDVVKAASCWAYIEGVLDSTPAGGEFSPGPDVRVSQYIDVTLAYLKDHANIRNQSAALLVQNALRGSFPHP
jgi:hypothetical protein